MSSLNPSLNPVTLVLERVHTWSVESQLGARRNAMVASTALAARRAEREDVEDFFAARAPQPSVPVAAQR